jgi:uncharacterized protein YbjT (DUF2867 family)
MLNILITGATGNVGVEVIKSLQKLLLPLNIVAGVRDAPTDLGKLKDHNISMVKFDITNPPTFATAFQHIDILFLLRPPQISEVEKYFKPLINSAVEANIKHILFLSVQGVEKSTIIPHHKIEKLIAESNIPYTFLRPAYFMQNFTTTLRDDIVNKKRVFLPAGKAKFTLVDVRDIGSVAAVVLTNAANHINKSYQLTCHQKLTFYEMAEKLSDGLGVKISYASPNIFTFYFAKHKEKTPTMLILVMIMLHYFPRFQKDPDVTDCIELITGKQPITFEKFIYDNKELLT